MASELGNSDSMVCLGKMYETGLIGNMKNYKKALYWYDKEAEAGKQDGLFKYAESLFLGKGVRKNYKLAFVVFVTLNNSGYKEAAYYLGQYYEKGIQIEKDYEKALYYYETEAHKQ